MEDWIKIGGYDDRRGTGYHKNNIQAIINYIIEHATRI